MSSNSDSRPVESDKLIDTIADYANTNSLDPFDTANSFDGIHYWLQQQIFDSFLKPAIIGLASQNTDKRNSKAVNECREIVAEQDWNTDAYDISIPRE
jgi:hypothetical protein